MKELNAVKTSTGPSEKQSIEGPIGPTVGPSIAHSNAQSAERPADLARNPASLASPRPTRREFLGIAAAAGMVAVTALEPRVLTAEPYEGPEVRCAVVGLGLQGRKIAAHLAQIPAARVVALCDLYEPYRRRAQRLIPGAETYDSVERMLKKERKLDAVVIATPTHLHREPALAALAAKKHVYCEAPIASTLEDARAMAEAAKKAKGIFAVGLQLRSNPHFDHALKFVKVRAIGSLSGDAAHWHQNVNWRRTAGDPKFTAALNWRLDADKSLGLFGEAGVHAFDTTLRSLKERPSSVTSFGSLTKWKDGRDLPDSVLCVLEFPSGFQSRFEASLVNSYGGMNHVVNGTHGAIFLAERRCWMFKEADAPSLGWEVYAKRERVAGAEGIVLVANATKLLDRDIIPGEAADEELASARDSLAYALEDFLIAINEERAPAAGLREGYESLVIASAAERSRKLKRTVEIDPAEFQLPEGK